MEYRLKFEKYYYPSRVLFYVERWQTDHECNCEFCEAGDGRRGYQRMTENDSPWILMTAIDEMYGHLGQNSPEGKWQPVSERQPVKQAPLAPPYLQNRLTAANIRRWEEATQREWKGERK